MNGSALASLEKLALEVAKSGQGSVRGVLLADQELPGLPGPWQDRWMGGWSGFRVTIRPIQYMEFIGTQLERGNSISAAIARLQEVLATPRASGAFLLGLVGPIVSQRIDLAPGLSLHPGTAYPERHSLVMGEGVWPHQVTSCVRGDAEQEAPFCREVQVPEREPKLISPDLRPSMDEVERLLGLFTFPCPVSSQGIVFAYDDPEIESLADSASARTLAAGQLPRDQPVTGKSVDSADIPAVWSGFCKLEKRSRERIKTACDRINRSLLQTQTRPVDACIEACIALEALFGGKQTDSLTHKLATRCARYMETTLESRAEAAQFVKDAYAKRSKGVHGGDSNSGLSATDLQGLCSMVVLAARRVVLMGKMPSDDELDFAP